MRGRGGLPNRVRSRKRGDRRSSLPPAPASTEAAESEAPSLEAAETSESENAAQEREASTEAAALEAAPEAAIETKAAIEEAATTETAEPGTAIRANAMDTWVDPVTPIPLVEAATARAVDPIEIKSAAESARRQAVTSPAPPLEPESTEPDATPLGLDVSGRQPSSPEMEEVFFNSLHPHGIEPEEEEEHPHARRFSEAAKARRSHLARYVKATIGTAMAIVLVAGLVRLASPTQQTSHATTTAAGPEIVAANPATEPAKPIAPAANTATSAATNSAPAAVAPASAPPPEVSAAPAVSAASVASVAPQAVAPAASSSSSTAPAVTGDAAHERAAAQAALESGRNKDAIAAGERSVAIDPTDGNAWLVLGAAYQENRDMVNARRCYRACVDQAKRGSIGECKAMAGR